MSYTAFKERFGIELNAQQEEAVQAIDGSVLLLAVPGSGKTTVLVNRLGYMILECGIAPENILTITYTDAATKDMKQRFSKKFGDQYGERVEFRTINGISQKILMFYGRQIGQKPYDIIDKKVQASLFKNIYKHVTKKFATEGDIKNIVDDTVREKIESVVNSKGMEALKDIVWMNEEKGVQIKKVRLYATSVTNPIALKKQRFSSEQEHKNNYYVVNDT